MSLSEKKVIKCAIYTRKSSEEGLEQDFNSLDAQREACESYIKSQQHEGWVLINKQYNDGGFSGGTLERPALKQLFQDIESGEVNIVVVYKVDRLTRSLMDFSKIVEIFDNYSASFVSITQHFNTTTSMGRLTLNILLSFAQFEREVTGERIRDKLAASKKKGIWVSGVAPIGYKLKEKKLIIDSDNAKKIKMIFDKYLELKSVQKLRIYLKENNIKTRHGYFFNKGPLYHILQNKVYIGLITHKENSYTGLHQAIIEKETFEKVKNLLSQNRIIQKSSVNSTNSSLLAGKIFDDKGNYMTPSHSNTRNRRYRYYVSQAILQFRRNEAGSVSKIPAGEIETLVMNEIQSFLSNSNDIQQYIKKFSIHSQKELLSGINNLQKDTNNALNRTLIRTVLYKIIIYKEKVEIILCKEQLIKALEAITYNSPFPEELKFEPSETIVITKDIRISATSKNGGVLIITDSKLQKRHVNDQLVKAVAKSFYWNNLLLFGEVKSITEIQSRENLQSNTYVKSILKLRFLAPDIIEAILNGTQPRDLNVQKLCSIKTLNWQEQKVLLQF